jgi:hypothetical protein
MSDENLNQENLNQIEDETKANNASVLIVDDTIRQFKDEMQRLEIFA